MVTLRVDNKAIPDCDILILPFSRFILQIH